MCKGRLNSTILLLHIHQTSIIVESCAFPYAPLLYSTKREKTCVSIQFYRIEYIAKSIGTSLRINEFRFSNHLFKFKHLGMQTAYTNICERMYHFQELSEFKGRTVIGFQESIREISSVLNIPWSTGSGILTKWN